MWAGNFGLPVPGRSGNRLVWSGDIMVFDEVSGRCGSCIDEIGVSLNGNAIQITLFKEEVK